MIATTEPSTEVLLEPATQGGFRSGTDCMGANSDDSLNTGLPATGFTWFAEEIHAPFRQR